MADTDNGKIIENTAKNEMENNMIQTYENSKDILPTVQVNPLLNNKCDIIKKCFIITHCSFIILSSQLTLS